MQATQICRRARASELCKSDLRHVGVALSSPSTIHLHAHLSDRQQAAAFSTASARALALTGASPIRSRMACSYHKIRLSMPATCAIRRLVGVLHGGEVAKRIRSHLRGPAGLTTARPGGNQYLERGRAAVALVAMPDTCPRDRGVRGREAGGQRGQRGRRPLRGDQAWAFAGRSVPGSGARPVIRAMAAVSLAKPTRSRPRRPPS